MPTTRPKVVIEKVGCNVVFATTPPGFFLRQYVLTMTDESIERPSQEMK